MRIYHNIPALTAYNSLNATSNAMQKSIEKLSTGLRINSAADDAAGFAISEKMRAQISGMEMAQRNAQDGISMLQTAEGALGETHSILQRMRELAVQAANDTLTQEDRSYIQLEVDELKNQVDDIANTTQFNKKRLLDGSCAGNWSSNDLRVKAYVRGSLREVDQFGQKSAFEGNFKIRIDAASTGSGEVQKTSIFKIKHPNVITDVSLNTKEGVEAVRVDNIPAGDFTIKAANVGAAPSDGSAQVTGAYGFDDPTAVWTGTAAIENLFAGDSTATTPTTGDIITVTVTNADGTTTKTDVELTTSADVAGLITDLTSAGFTVKGVDSDSDSTDDTIKITVDRATKIEVEITQSEDSTATTAPTATGDSVTISGLDDLVNITADNAENNASILFEVVSVGSDSVTLKASSNVLKADGTMANYTLDNIILTEGGSSAGSVFDLSSLLGEDKDTGHFTMNLKAATGEASAFEAGDKFVINVSGKGDGTTDPDMTVKIAGTQDQNWPDKWGGTVTLNDLQYNINSTKVQNREVHFRNYYLNSDNGKVYEGDIVLTTNGDFDATGTGTTGPKINDGDTLASFTSAYIGKIATGDTCLRDLDKFWNSQGVFMLEDPQTITITQGDGKSAKVTLYATDTINDMKNKLNNAIASDLGQGQYVTDNANKFVTFVENAQNSGFETVQGTFLIRSIIPGTAGSLTFSGDEDFINAFATNVVSKSSETSFTASLYDAHTGAAIATGVTVTGNKLIGVLHENVDLEFDALADIKAKWSEADKNFILQSAGGYEAIIHQTGANEGEDMAIDIGNMSADALGISGVNVTTRASAMKAVGDLDSAITQVSRQRAKIGAYQNALEWTSENLSTTATNLTAAESRIRDADMAKEMMEFVKLQILNQSGTSMLAQANQLPQQVLSLLQ